MPTIVDSLVVTLGLDSSQYIKGHKDAMASFSKTKDQAVKDGKELEEQSKKTAGAVDNIGKKMLGLMAIFLGGRGLKEFTEYITQSNAALGRQSANLQMSARDLSAWGMAAERVGGSMEATKASFLTINDAVQALRTSGQQFPMALSQIQAWGGRQIDINHGIEKSFEDLAFDLQRVAETRGRSQANFLGRQAGLDDATINVMLANKGKLSALIQDIGKLAPTDDQIARSQQMQDSWTKMTQSAEKFGGIIVDAITPALTKVADATSALFDAMSASKAMNDAVMTKAETDFAAGRLPRDAQGRDLRSLGQVMRDWWSGKTYSDTPGPGASAAPPRATLSDIAGVGAQSSNYGDLRLGGRYPGEATAGGPADTGLIALAHHLQDTDAVDKFSAFNDATHNSPFHEGSKHTQGLAFDAVMKNADYEAARARVRAYLSGLGFQEGRGKDFWIEPGTTDHLHVQFENHAAAARYAALGAASNGGATGAGNSMSAAARNSLVTPGGGVANNSVSSHEVNIGPVTVNSQATDGYGVARDFEAATRYNFLARQANTGPQ